MTTQAIAYAAVIDLRDSIAQNMNALDEMPPAWQAESFRSDMERVREVISLLEAIPHS